MTTSATPRRSKLTGRQVAGLRARMQLDVQALAEALGVHASSVYRWEASAKPALRPTVRVVLDRLLQLDDDTLRAIGERIRASTDRITTMQQTLVAVIPATTVAA